MNNQREQEGRTPENRNPEQRPNPGTTPTNTGKDPNRTTDREREERERKEPHAENTTPKPGNQPEQKNYK